MKDSIVIIGNNSGGMYSFRKELIQELIRKGHKVVVLTPFDDCVEDLKRLGVKMISTPIDRRGMNPLTDLQLFQRYYRILKKLAPDMVITYTIKPNVYAGFACRLLRIPFVANITGLGTAFQKRGMIQELVTFMYKRTIRKAKVVFFENVENRDILVRKKILPKSRTHVLNGAGVNLEQYGFAEYPDVKNGLNFLFIGRVMREKGIDELFAAMSRLQKEKFACSLHILGMFEEDYKETVEQYEQEGWLHYHGFQSDVRPFIEDCHCFVLPSWHEGMANTNLECAAMGRPVITSNIHGCKEAVMDGISGFLCEKQDADSLYQVMKKFLQLSQEERCAMGLAGRKYMEDVFDKKKVVDDTVKCIFE